MSLNWLNREELLAHLVPLKQTSLDCDNNVYMTEDDTVVVNFDKVVGEYGSRCGTSCARSVDALYCDRDGTCCLIEFKNGKLDKGKIFEIKQKIYDSLLILSDITGLTLKDYRSELEFILVYNKEKNPNLFNAFPAPSNSPALCGLANGLARKSKKAFEAESLESFERYCFKRVREMPAETLEEHVFSKAHSAWGVD